jgi:DNA polymerase-3 subunit delta'
VLTCTDVGLLPLTIVSRCQVLRLGVVPVPQLAAALAQRGAPSDQAELIAGLVGGRVGRAFDLLADKDGLAERARDLAELRALDAAGRAERLKEAERLAQDHGKSSGATARRLDLLIGWWRDLLLVRTGCEELVVNRDQIEALRARAEGLEVEQIRGAIRSIEQTAQFLDENVQPRIALESLALSLPS